MVADGGIIVTSWCDYDVMKTRIDGDQAESSRDRSDRY